MVDFKSFACTTLEQGLPPSPRTILEYKPAQDTFVFALGTI